MKWKVLPVLIIISLLVMLACEPRGPSLLAPEGVSSEPTLPVPIHYVTYLWMVPKSGTPVVRYEIEVELNGNIRVMYSVTNVINIQYERSEYLRIRVQGFDQFDSPGCWSGWSSVYHLDPFEEIKEEYNG